MAVGKDLQQDAFDKTKFLVTLMQHSPVYTTVAVAGLGGQLPSPGWLLMLKQRIAHLPAASDSRQR